MSKFDPDRPAPPGGGSEPKLSRASVQRFSLYLRHLQHTLREGTNTLSSGQLGEALGITDAQVRKDLAYLGNLGQPGIGYPIPEVIQALKHKLGIDRSWTAVIVGAGNLARALLRYRGFEEQGFRFVALFDADVDKIGTKVEDLEVQPLANLPEVVKVHKPELGVLTVPAGAAQGVADVLVGAGIRGILNFAPTVLRLPPGIRLVAVDLAVQLEQLAFLVHLAPEATP